MSIPTVFLALEASTRCVSVAVFQDGDCAAADFLHDPKRHHSETLLPMVKSVLTRAGLTMTDVSAVGTTRGPGSFTSVRIGLASAAGLAFARSVPLYALSTLETLAGNAARADGSPAYEWAMPLMDARKGEVYAALCRLDDPLNPFFIEPTVMPLSEWLERSAEVCNELDPQQAGRPLALVGEGALAYRAEIEAAMQREPTRAAWTILADDAFVHPHAEILGRRLLARLACGDSGEPPIPAYLRQPEAVVNLLARR